jgi:hypothetical protein
MRTCRGLGLGAAGLARGQRDLWNTLQIGRSFAIFCPAAFLLHNAAPIVSRLA